MSTIPNLLDSDVPSGQSEDDNVEVRNAKNITIISNKKIIFNLLYNRNSNIEKKIKIEQSRRETKPI